MRLHPNTGFYVSGAGHVAFIIYLIVGGLFVARETDLDVVVSNVSILSGEEFEAMQAQSPGEIDAPPAPEVANEVDQPAPAIEPETPSTPPAPPEPIEPIEQTPPEPDPVIPEPPVEQAPPEPPQPETPDVSGDPGATIISPDARPIPRPAERVTDEVIEAPEPEVAIADEDQAPTAPAEDATPVEEAREETARHETTSQVVTEADEPSAFAPSKSARPGRKPKPPARPAAPSLADSINDAVNEATTDTAAADNANPGGGTSSPITRQEKGTFILGIQKCWNVGALGTDALAVSVVVGFKMDQSAKPIAGSVQMISAKGGSGSAVDKAYGAARRAILRCGAKGYNLPLDKYDQWREVEVSFNATNKEIR